METPVNGNGVREQQGNDAYFAPARVSVSYADDGGGGAALASPVAPSASSSGRLMSRAEILRSALTTRRRAPVEMPEWGGVVYAVEMTKMQQELARNTRSARRYPDGSVQVTLEPLPVRMKCYMQCIEDESGTRLFADGDVEAFMTLPFTIIERLTDAIDAVTSPADAEPDTAETVADPT